MVLLNQTCSLLRDSAPPGEVCGITRSRSQLLDHFPLLLDQMFCSQTFLKKDAEEKGEIMISPINQANCSAEHGRNGSLRNCGQTWVSPAVHSPRAASCFVNGNAITLSKAAYLDGGASRSSAPM